MNSIELFYQLFNMRYSLEEMERPFVEDYRLALVGSSDNISRVKEWLGAATPCSGLHENLLEAELPTRDGCAPNLELADTVICHLGAGKVDDACLRRYLDCFSSKAAVLFIYEPDLSEDDAHRLDSYDASLPGQRAIFPGLEEEYFCAAVFSALPRRALRLARDYENLRRTSVRILINSSSRSMGLLAACSSLPSSLPVLGSFIALLATSAETFAITAEQLHLVLLLGALYGRPVSFFDRVGELWPVVGGSWGWRAVARELVGFVPLAGPLVKATIAASGTYFIGRVAQRFYELGEAPSASELESIKDEARLFSADSVVVASDHGSEAVKAVTSICGSKSGELE